MPKLSRKNGGRRPGAGRKPNPPHLQRKNAVIAYFTDAEMAELEKQRGDNSRSNWLRQVALRWLRF